MSPTLAAQMAATYQRVSGGRLLLNVVVGGDEAEQRRFGDYLAKDERYARAGEFLTIVRGAVERARRSTSPASTSRSRARSVPDAAGLARDLLRRLLAGGARGRRAPRRRLPDLGRAARAGRREARPRARRWPTREGRELRFGIRLHAIARDTVRGGVGGGRPAARRPRPGADRARRRRTCARPQSEGQRRMLALHGGQQRRRSRSHPNLWAGVGLVRGGAGTALVGSYEEVADRIAEYHELGHRRVHPLRLSPPRGGLPRRRRRAPDPARARVAQGGGRGGARLNQCVPGRRRDAVDNVPPEVEVLGPGGVVQRVGAGVAPVAVEAVAAVRRA